MTDLLTLAREHDLPPKWDGVVVRWRGWRTLPDARIFICPPPKEIDHCKNCGSIAQSRINYGHRTVFLAGKDRDAGSLTAYRCPDCLHDLVEDETTGEWFDLDHTDYGPEGSRD